MAGPLSMLRLLLVLLTLLPATAWASVTTGTIKGTAIDEGGLPIPGVLVSISSENMMGSRQLETAADGRFLFHELPPGIYSLSADKAGFASVKRPNLQVSIGHNTIVTLEMPLMTAGEEIVVEETSPTIDTESAARGSVLTKQFLERIPTGQSYQEAVQMAAGVTGGANANVGGAASDENTYMLDGVNITDPVTGTFSLNFAFDAIEQLEVLTGAFDPEYGESLGGAINIVTETGGNTLEFLVRTNYTNGNWAPKLDDRWGADGTQIAPTDFDSTYTGYLVAAKIAGPIVRDKAWFIGTYQTERTLIANVGIDLPRDYEGHYVMGKITYQPSSAHRFILLGQTNPTTVDNLDQYDRFVKPEAQSRQAQGGFVGSLQWDWFISPDSFLETKTLLQKIYIEQYGVPCTHDQDLGYHPCEPTELENHVDLETPARIGLGTAYDRDSAGFFYIDDRWRGSLTSKFSLLQMEAMGTHDLKAGIELDFNSWNQAQGYAGNVYFYDINEYDYDPDTYTNYYWVETTGAFFFKATAYHTGAFIQDVYKPIDNLTFRYGVRYDRSQFRDDLGRKVIDVGLWGPRFYAIWDPWGDNKTKLSAGMGRFNDTGRLGVASFLSKSGYGYKLSLGEYFGDSFYESTEYANYYTIPNETNVSFLEENTAPHSDEFTAGIEREVPRNWVKDMSVGIDFTGKFTRDLYEDDELNLLWDEDGYNILGSRFGDTDVYYRLRTPSIARRDYYRTDFFTSKQFSDRWEGFANYSRIKSMGSSQGSITYFMDVAQQDEYYVNGLLWTDVTNDVSAGFAWDLPDDPWTTTLGATFWYETGNPEPRYYGAAWFGGGSLLRQTYGTYAREEDAWALSTKVQQEIPVRKGKLSAEATVTNILNRRQGQSAGISSDNRWIISYRQDPITATVGAVYEF